METCIQINTLCCFAGALSQKKRGCWDRDRTWLPLWLIVSTVVGQAALSMRPMFEKPTISVTPLQLCPPY